VELPSGTKTWTFDENAGLEVFVAYVSSKESSDVKAKIVHIVEQARKSSAGRVTVLETLHQRLTALAPCNPKGSGEFVHNLTGVIPSRVETYAYQAQNGRSALLCQIVQHRP
jgi:hypothetical protein